MKRGEHRDYAGGTGLLVRPLFRALWSALIPGVGQIAGGARRRGLAMLMVPALLLVLAVVFAFQGIDQILSWLVRPPFLLSLFGFNLLVLGFRLFAVVDAYRLRRTKASAEGAAAMPRPVATDRRAGAGKPPALRVAAAGLALGLLLLLTVVPHGIAGYYAYISHDLLTTVFVGGNEARSGSTSSGSSSPTTPRSIPPLTTVAQPPTTGLSPTTGPSPSTGETSSTSMSTTTSRGMSTTEAPPESVPTAVWGEDQRLTILLIGSDAGYGRTGSRADSIMIVTVNLGTGYAALFGIPRNTGDIPLDGPAAKALGTTKYANLISSLYWDSLSYPELAPEGGDPGAIVLLGALSTLLGIAIDYYAVVDMAGLVDLIDAFGGVTVNVQERVHVRLSPSRKGEEWRVYDIQPGKQRLDGREALAFARSRTGTSDYTRMGRQRCVLAALLNQNGMAELALKFPAVVRAIKSSLRTDIPLDKLADLIRVRGKIKTDRILTLGFIPPDYIVGRNRLGYNILDRELVQATVWEIVQNPDSWLEAHGGGTDADPTDCWKVD